MSTRIQLRRGTASEGTAQNPILASGEVGYETNTGKAKIGDGATAWDDLAYSIIPADQVAGKALVTSGDGDFAWVDIGTQAELNALSATVAAITSGADPSLDTFLEAYTRFLSDESAASALTTTVAGKVDKSTLTTDGDLYTRAAGAVTRMTRDDLAADPAFTETFVAPQLVAPTGGAGTVASQWTHADGTGGIKTAIAAARAANKPLWVSKGHYAITSKLDGFADNDVIHFEPGVVFHPTGFVGGGVGVGTNIVEILGSSGDYIENLTITGHVHVDRSAQGSTNVRDFFFQYVKKSNLTVMLTRVGGSGNLRRLENVTLCRFGKIALYDGITPGAAHFEVTVTKCQFDEMYAYGCDETTDLANCAYNQYAPIYGEATNEVVDIGSSQYCQFESILGLNTLGGVNFKIDAGINALGVVGCHVGSAVFIEPQAGALGIVVFSNAAEGVPCDDNSIDDVYIRSTTAGVTAVNCLGFSAAAPVKRAHIGRLDVVCTKYAVVSKYTEDLEIESGYAESTGNFEALFFNHSGSDVFQTIRPKVKLQLKSAVVSTDSGAAWIGKAKDFRLDLDVLGCASGNGVVLYQSLRGKVQAGDIGECGYNGVLVRVVDDANYRGSLHIKVRRNRFFNLGKQGDATNAYGVKTKLESGTPQHNYINVDQNDFFDTQTVATTKGVLWTGTQDFETMIGNVFGGSLAAQVSGGQGANGRWITNSPLLADDVRDVRIGNATAAGNARVNGPVGSTTDFSWQRASVSRWIMRVANDTESGSNAGTSWRLIAFADDGSSIGNALDIRRSDRLVTLGQCLKTASGATGSRPTASSVPAGAQWFDTTLGKPIWSDGVSAWKDAAGSTV